MDEAPNQSAVNNPGSDSEFSDSDATKEYDEYWATLDPAEKKETLNISGRSCPICSNLRPELRERPRKMALTDLQERAQLGCPDCAILISGYETYMFNHPETPQGPDTYLRPVNAARLLRVEIDNGSDVDGPILEFYTDAG